MVKASNRTISTSLEAAKRLYLTKQHLAGKLPAKATAEQILSVVGDTCFIQWDPIDAVAPSHIIALWSRLGSFRRSDLDRLLWDQRKLFMHWNPACIVRTNYYPLLYSLMRRYPESISDSWGGWKRSARKVLSEHKELRKKILAQLEKGPLQVSEFEGYKRTKSPDGWTPGSPVANVLFHLMMTGDVVIVGHRGNQNLYGLTENFLPDWIKKEELTADEFEYEMAQRFLQALGVATSREIFMYFPRARYLNLQKNMESLQEEFTIHRVAVEGIGGRDELYVHEKDVGLLELMDGDDWQPRMTLLPPFDNLLCDRGRLKKLFSFDYIHENFLPNEKRKFGTFVHPILWGDKIIGRADLLKDKKSEKLMVNSLHAEPLAPKGKEVAIKVKETIRDLAEFLGTKEVDYTARVPPAWRSSL